MPDASDLLVERLIRLLAEPSSPLRREGIQLFVDHVLETKLKDAVELPRIHAIVLASLTRENVSGIVARHVQPGWRRYGLRVGQADDRLGDLLPDDAREALRAYLQQPTGARGKWLRGAIDPSLLKRLLGPVWVQLLLNFAKRIPGLGGTAGAPSGTPAPKTGIASLIGRSVQQQAGRLVDAGRSALEGLGIDLEKKLLAAARDFSDGALAIWNSALRERLRSEEGRAIVAQIKLGVLEHVLRTPLKDLQLEAAALPVEPLIDLAPAVLSHAAGRAFVRAVVEEELHSFMQVEGERSLADLLRELGVFAEVREHLCARADSSFADWSRTPGFAGWFGRLLEAAAKP